MNVRGILFVLGLLSGGGPAVQDHAKTASLTAMKTKGEDLLLFDSRFDAKQVAFLKDLRKVPRVKVQDASPKSILKRYLKQNATSVSTLYCHIESDYLTGGELRDLASHVHKIRSVLKELLGVIRRRRVVMVVRKRKALYLELIGKLTSKESTKKKAQRVSGITVRGIRVTYKRDYLRACRLVRSDAVRRALPVSLDYQVALREGLHTYLSAFVLRDYTSYVSLSSTTPDARNSGKVGALFHTAREHFLKKQKEDLRTILISDLNGMTFERLSVSFALVDFLLRTKRDRWSQFQSTLKKRSFGDDGKILGPEGRRNALAAAIKSAFETDYQTLEEDLEEFVLATYALPEDEVAELLSVRDDVSSYRYGIFRRVVRKKREGKKVPKNQEKIYREVREALDKAKKSSSIQF